MLFTLAADAQQRINTFRADRIAKIAADRGPVTLPANGRLIVHLVPLSTFGFGYTTQIDLERAWQVRRFFVMKKPGNVNYHYNLDGFINVYCDSECYGYTQFFRNGIVEATNANILISWKGSNVLHESTTADIVGAVPDYFDGLRMIDVPAPIILMLSFQGVAGAKLGMEGSVDRLDKVQSFPEVDPLLLPEVILDDYGSRDDYARALRPVFNTMWNAAGFPRCTRYDVDGNWKH